MAKKAHKLETVGVVDAYDELSQEAFSIWMRLHMLDDEQLATGHTKLCRVVGYSEARYIAILRDLRVAGYVKFIPAERPGLPTTLQLLKVCKIAGRNRFVNLSNFLVGGEPASGHSEEDLPCPFAQNSFANRPQGRNQPTGDVQANEHAFHEAFGVHDTQTRFGETAHSGDSADGSEDSERTIGNLSFLCAQREPANTHSGGLHIGGGMVAGKKSTGGKHQGKVKFLTFDGGIKPVSDTGHDSDVIVDSPNPNSGLDLAKYSKERRPKGVPRRPKHPDSGKPIDWTKLDQLGKPAITFSPSESERETLTRLLTTDLRKLDASEKRLKRDMEKKLEQEFIRLYERYRKAAMREKGWTSVSYDVLSKERKYALSAAVACIVKGVTPRQVFEYWHTNITHFANSKMSVPPLPFLSQPANIDEVYIALMEAKHSGPKRCAPGKPRSMHTMSDTSLLDPRFRPALTDAGFDLSEMNDVYLTTVQAYAVDVAAGETKARFIPSKLREMVKWAAANFFVGKCLDDYI